VKVTVNKVDEANIRISGTIENSLVEANVNALAIQAAKEMNVDGFRKGKVPAHIAKKLHGNKLTEDAESEALKDLIDAGVREAQINVADILGQPTFKKYNKKDDGIEVIVEVSIRPAFELEGYMDVVPSFDKPIPTDEEVEEKLAQIAGEQAPFEKIETQRAVENGDTTLIDFEGFIAGIAFDGGKAEKFSLKIGSGQFIPGFEEQIIGMKYAEEKTVTVTFPAAYQSADLAGKEAKFKVKLHEIQEQVTVEINDALAQKLLQDDKSTLDTLREKLKEQIASESLSKIYNEDLKPKIVEALVDKFNFALPNNIVEQEIDAKINAKAQDMDEEELNSFKNNPEKVDLLREEVRVDAKESVKATFIVDALAKKEKINVDDQEVSQALYYEAMISGQNPEEMLKYYEEKNLLSAVKMGMIEDKLFGKMLGLEK